MWFPPVGAGELSLVPEGAVVSGAVGPTLLEGLPYTGVEDSGVKVGKVSRGAVEVVSGELATVDEVSATEVVWLLP